MILSQICATDVNVVIGFNSKIPWHLPADLKRFYTITYSRPIIMGRRTYDSLPKAPLPGRLNIVLTRSLDLHQSKPPNLVYVDSIQDAIAVAGTEGTSEAIVIGGAEIYKLTMPMVSKVYLTRIPQPYHGDAHYPISDLLEYMWYGEADLPHKLDAFDTVIITRAPHQASKVLFDPRAWFKYTE